MWIEEFDTALAGEKAAPETRPFYISKICLPISWGSEEAKRKYESASRSAKESMERAAFRANFGASFGEAAQKIEVSESWTGSELTLRDEREIPDFRFRIQLKDRETSDPKAVLFAVDWNGKPLKRKLPDGSEVDGVYLWHLFKEPDRSHFRQQMMFRAEYGYYLDFRYYVQRLPNQPMRSCRKPNGSLDLAALMLEEPGTWVHWKIREPRAEELRKMLGTYFIKKS